MYDISYREYVRAGILIVLIVLVGAFYGAGAFGTALGGALVLSIIWFVIKGYKPSWTAGWSGAWLYLTGVLTVITAGVLGFDGPVNPWAVGIGIATVVVAPSMVGWKFFGILSGDENGGGDES